ncbi:MAG TPA: DUF2207 domain-containing protein [Candidatus Acidoferrales bacterium]|nr:DUF2207 domain-containing protein [Candidatus Acidoferrales bacterium]
MGSETSVRILFIFALLLVMGRSTPAWARSYQVSQFTSAVHVQKDGSADIQEKITFVFRGHFQGVYRDIPVEYPGPKGTNYSLFVTVNQVTDENGSTLKFEKSRSRGFLKLKIYVPGASDSTRTVNIDYSASDATKFFPQFAEFYWNVTGNDWLVPIQSASTTVYFPADAAGNLRVQAYQGIYGSQDPARASIDEAVVTAESTGPLPARGGLTVDVYIPEGILREPSTAAKLGRFLRSNPILSLPFWAFAVMFGLWWYKGRDPNAGLSVAPMYEPPEGLRPAEAGTLIDDSVDPRDVTSVLVDLAVRGYIKIVEAPHKGLLFSTKDYEFHLLKDRDAWNDLNDYERAMLDKIYAGGGTVTRLSDLRNHFYTVLPLIKTEVVTALKAKGMYTVDPDSAHQFVILGALAIALPYLAAQVLHIADFTNSVGPLVVCTILAFLIIILFGRQLSATSLKGARTRVQVLGFQEFMNRVDADRLKRMPPDTFEKYLPYAMALGVEHRWAKAFQGIIQNPPTWYQGDWTTFNTFYFVNSLGALSQQATSTFVSAPRSSSSSSGWSRGGFSSGGGFSGGGFGGGGGGAF